MSRLASGQSEGVETGTGQESAACHSCSAGRLLVVPAYPDLAREAAPGVATGLGEGRTHLVQEHRLVTGACGLAYEGGKDAGDYGRHAEMLWVKMGPSRLPAPGKDLVGQDPGQDPVDEFRVEVEEQDFRWAGPQRGTMVVRTGL
jgi:hypothetical protein